MTTTAIDTSILIEKLQRQVRVEFIVGATLVVLAIIIFIAIIYIIQKQRKDFVSKQKSAEAKNSDPKSMQEVIVLLKKNISETAKEKPLIVKAEDFKKKDAMTIEDEVKEETDEDNDGVNKVS